MKCCLSVFTLKYTFCMGWHSCWCLMLNDMIQRRSWEVTHRMALELPLLNRVAEVPKYVQCGLRLILLCLLQCSHSLFAHFSLPSNKKQRAAGAQDISPYVAISPVRQHLPRPERTRVQLPASYTEDAVRHYPFTSLPLKTFSCPLKSSRLPWEDCLCQHSLGSTALQSGSPDGSAHAAPSRGVSRLWRHDFFEAKFEAEILLNPLFWMVPTVKSHQWRNRNNRAVVNTNWNCC